MIDNYDSFTYNLVHLFEELGAEVVTVRNDAITVDEARDGGFDRLVVSPGPGRPETAGVSIELIRALGPTVPTLGVCLGHQAIVEAFGGTVGQAKALLHGKASTISHDGLGVYAELPADVEVGRYHSLAALEIPEELDRHLAHARRRGDGRAPPRAPDRGRAVPSGERADTARARDGEELPPMIVGPAIQLLLDGHHLSRADARELMGSIMDGEATDAQIAGFLVALRTKGETADEIAGFAEAMREHVVPVTPQRAPVVDIVGTGGDGAHTFNISTAAALVAAAAGAAVAKHGNRAASSQAGSADVLEELGIALEQPPERIALSIDDLGFGFMFARAHHPAMRFVAPVRQEIGIRTVFNVLGPLANPAGACDGVFGVYSPALVPLFAEALAELGARRAFVVHGEGGLDELSPSGPSLVAEIVDGDVTEWELDPRDLGIEPSDPAALRGGSAAENAAIIRAVLAGETGGRRDAVLLNASGALVAAGLADDLVEGIALGAETIDSGAAASRLEALVSFSAEEAA